MIHSASTVADRTRRHLVSTLGRNHDPAIAPERHATRIRTLGIDLIPPGVFPNDDGASCIVGNYGKTAPIGAAEALFSRIGGQCDITNPQRLAYFLSEGAGHYSSKERH